MALQAGNRTYYNPTNGIEWRGNRLPYNTFYAILCLFCFFFMAFILRMCYKAYRNEIRLAERKQNQGRQRVEHGKPVVLNFKSKDPPVGILKVDDTKPKDDETGKSVQFAEETRKCSGSEKKPEDGVVLDNGLISWHL